MLRSSPKIASLMIFIAIFAVYWNLPGIVDQLGGAAGLFRLLVLVGLIPFVVGPIQLHRTQFMALRPEYEPFDPAGPAAAPEVRAYFHRASAELARLGFVADEAYQLQNGTKEGTGFVLSFQNQQTAERAKILTVIALKGDRRQVSSSALFTTEFTDGTEIVTGNRSSARVFPHLPPPYHATVFPQIQQTGQLLSVHRAMVNRYDAGRIRVNPLLHDPAGLIRTRDYDRTLHHVVACGYYHVDEPAGVQRLTWKGAILMAWKLTPPIKQILLGRERSEAARRLRRLGRERRLEGKAS